MSDLRQDIASSAKGQADARRRQRAIWVPFAIAALVILGGGIGRIFIDAPRLPPIDVDSAVAWAECLARGRTIAQNTNVTLVGLPSTAKISEGSSERAPEDYLDKHDIEPDPAERLRFVSAAPIQVALDPASIEALKSGRKVTLRELTFSGSVGTFYLENGAVEVRDSSSNYLLVAIDALRFAPVPDASYSIVFDEGHLPTLSGIPENGTPELPTRTTGWLVLSENRPVSLLTSDRLPVSPWPVGTAATLLPERAIGQKGLADLSIQASRTGMRFDDRELALSACGSAGGEGTRTHQVGIAKVEPGDPGVGTLVLGLPEAMVPVFATPVYEPWSPIELAVASDDGRYLAYGGFTIVDRGWAALLAAIATVALFWWVSNLRVRRSDGREDWSRWFMGLFIGRDRDPSLSLFQIFVWTVITVWGLIYVYFVAGSLLTITTQVVGLLAISGTGAVLARWIATSRGGSTSLPAGAAASSETPEFWQMLSTQGTFDLLKLQLFVFTLLIGAYVVWRLLDTGAFPELDQNTLLLLGVSQGTYIAGKLSGSNTLNKAVDLKARLDSLQNGLDVKKAELGTLTTQASELAQQKGTLDPALSEQDKQNRLAEITAKETELAAKRAKLEQEIQVIEGEKTKLTTEYDAALAEIKLARAPT